MAPKHKYFGTPMIYFVLFVFAAIAFMLAGYVVDGVFEFLCDEFPNTFKSESFVSNPDGYERQTKLVVVFTVTLALLGINYLSLLLDNKRMEHIARSTEGRYTLSEGIVFYIREFLISDIITAVIPPILLSIPAYFVPELWLDYGLNFPLLISVEMCDAFGFSIGTSILLALSILTRLAVVPVALSRWRAAWLSGTAEVI